MQATHLINVTCATQTEKNILISIIYNIHFLDILSSHDLMRVHIKLAASTHCMQEGYENAVLVFFTSIPQKVSEVGLTERVNTI